MPSYFQAVFVLCLWAVLSMFTFSKVYAETSSFGLAMHGQPKYAADDTVLTYADPDVPKGGTLRTAAIGTFDTLNPYAIKGKAAQGLNLVYDRLMARVWDEPFTMYPLIAERVEVPEDRSSITVYLNPKARFHDGSAVTAEDVLFSFNTLKNFGRPNMRQIYRLVKTVEKQQDGGIFFKFGDGFDRETVMIIAMMPVLSKAYWDGRTFDSTTLETPILNGPYRIKSMDPGRQIVYERVKDYWAADLLTNVGHHNFDEIIYDYYRDDTVAFEAFKTGDLDLRHEYDAGQWATGYNLPVVKSGQIILDEIAHSRPEKVRGFIFNTRRAPFDDIRVREAFNLLFDFEWMNHNLFHGGYRRISSMFPNSELAASGTPSPAELALLEPWRDQLSERVFGEAYTPSSHKTPQEIRAHMREADQLLNAAGWRVENGKRMKDGQSLSFEILLGAPEDEKIALHFKRALEKMGITPHIRVLDVAAYRGRLNAYDFDMMLYFWHSSLSPGTEQILYWGCQAAEEPARWNFAGICHPAVDRISKAIATSESRESLVAHVRALDRILMHGQYMIPLYYAGKDTVARRARIKRPDKIPLYGMVFETWWAE